MMLFLTKRIIEEVCVSCPIRNEKNAIEFIMIKT